MLPTFCYLDNRIITNNTTNNLVSKGKQIMDKMKIPVNTVKKIAARLGEDLINPYGYAGWLESHFTIDGYDVNLSIKKEIRDS